MGLYLEAMEIDNTNISKDGHLKLGQPLLVSLKHCQQDEQHCLKRTSVMINA